MARAALADGLRRKRSLIEPVPNDPLQIELRGEHLRRYQHIHARKMRQYQRGQLPDSSV